MRTILLSIILLPFTLLSQSEIDFYNSNSLKIGIGFSRSAIKDLRLSNSTFNRIAPKYTIGYIQANENRISSIDFSFSSFLAGQNTLLALKNLNIGIDYSYQRKVNKNIWIGGFLDHRTLLNFPKSKTWLYNNNPISYTLSQSIGPKITYGKQMGKLSGLAEFQTALLSYLVQPIYGHPYPDKFLDEEVFNPNLSGLAGPLLKSGKVVSLNKYRSFKLKMSLVYHFNHSIATEIAFSTDCFYANANGKAVNYSGFDSMINFYYKH